MSHELHPRAKNVLDLCAHELRNVSIDDQATIETVVSIEIEEAIKDRLISLKKKTSKEVDEIMEQTWEKNWT